MGDTEADWTELFNNLYNSSFCDQPEGNGLVGYTARTDFNGKQLEEEPTKKIKKNTITNENLCRYVEFPLPLQSIQPGFDQTNFLRDYNKMMAYPKAMSKQLNEKEVLIIHLHCEQHISEKILCTSFPNGIGLYPKVVIIIDADLLPARTYAITTIFPEFKGGCNVLIYIPLKSEEKLDILSFDRREKDTFAGKYEIHGPPTDTETRNRVLVMTNFHKKFYFQRKVTTPIKDRPWGRLDQTAPRAKRQKKGKEVADDAIVHGDANVVLNQLAQEITANSGEQDIAVSSSDKWAFDELVIVGSTGAGEGRDEDWGQDEEELGSLKWSQDPNNTVAGPPILPLLDGDTLPDEGQDNFDFLISSQDHPEPLGSQDDFDGILDAHSQTCMRCNLSVLLATKLKI